LLFDAGSGHFAADLFDVGGRLSDINWTRGGAGSLLFDHLNDSRIDAPGSTRQ
jgi:hypothetical protein